MKRREIFSLLAACHEVTYDDKDNMRRVYIDEEKTVKSLDDLKKALSGLPANVQKEFRDYQEKVLGHLEVYKFKYPQLMEKAKSMFDPAALKVNRKEREKIVVTTGNKEAPASKESES